MYFAEKCLYEEMCSIKDENFTNITINIYICQVYVYIATLYRCGGAGISVLSSENNSVYMRTYVCTWYRVRVGTLP